MCATSTGVKPIPAPDATPNRAAKVMSAAFPVAGSQKARIRIMVKKLIVIIMLKWPTLSARALGTVRPMMLRVTSQQRWTTVRTTAGVSYLAPFRIGTRYCDKPSDMPPARASTTMKVMGMNMPP